MTKTRPYTFSSGSHVEAG